MIGNWWHLAQTPDGPHAHHLDAVALDLLVAAELVADPDLTPAEAEAEVLGDEAERIRRELGFPARARWVGREGWDSSLSQGEPHPSFLAAATVHRAVAINGPTGAELRQALITDAQTRGA